MKRTTCAFFPFFLTLYSMSVYCAIKINFGFNLQPFVLRVPRFKLPPIKITASFKPSHHSGPFALQFPGLSVNTYDHEEQSSVPYSDPWVQPKTEPEPEAPGYHRGQSYWAKTDLVHNYNENKGHTLYERSGGSPHLSIKPPDELTSLIHQKSALRTFSDRKRQPSEHQDTHRDSRWMNTNGENANRFQIQQEKLKKRSRELQLSTGQNYAANLSNIALTKKRMKTRQR